MPKDSQNTEQLRAQAEQLLSQARAQVIEVQRALGAAGDGALQSRLTAVAAQISGAISELSLALNTPGFALHQINLAALEGLVHSDEVSTLLTQVAAQAKGSTALAEAVITASAATRREAQNLAGDLFQRRIFDPYLHFSSAEDEEAFRRREAEAQKYVAAQLARHTPEGDLNAGGGVLGYMLDAHTHGAGGSPEFMGRWETMVAKAQSQRAAMHAAGQSTEEFDRRLVAKAHDFLKAQRLSEAEINARLAAVDGPLDAVKPFLKHEAEGQHTEHGIRAASEPQPLTGVEASSAALPQGASLSIDMVGMDAKLKAAGLQVPSPAEAATEGHGLAAVQPVAAARASLPR
jgi:hypothetical protein